MKLYKIGEKNVKIKILIWHMLGEIVENGVEQGILFMKLFLQVIATFYWKFY